MSVDLLMTETAQLYRIGTPKSDGIGGYTQNYVFISNISCKIDARTEKDEFVDDVMMKEVTNVIYTKSAIYEKDILAINSTRYSVMMVVYFKDVLNFGNDHYKLFCKKVVD